MSSVVVGNRVAKLVGTTIDGRYRVDAVIARGGMGVVLRGTHLVLGQPVAIKVMLDGGMRDPTLRERFLREARILAQVRAPSIAAIHDAGQLADGTLFLVMELLDGEDLEKVLARGPLSTVQAARLLAEVCDGLAEAHEQGIVHRDLKPANVFLVKRASGGTLAKVIDFGISKRLGDSEVTDVDQVIGSPYYMAPEQVLSSRDVDRRADIWSLGVVLFRLVVGKQAFEGPSLSVILGRIKTSAPGFPEDVDPAFAAVVRRCLEKDRERRYHTVHELRDALLELARTGTTSPSQAARLPDAPEPPTLDARRSSSEPGSADATAERLPLLEPEGFDEPGMITERTRMPFSSEIAKETGPDVAALVDDAQVTGVHASRQQKTDPLAEPKVAAPDLRVQKKTMPMMPPRATPLPTPLPGAASDARTRSRTVPMDNRALREAALRAEHEARARKLATTAGGPSSSFRDAREAALRAASAPPEKSPRALWVVLGIAAVVLVLALGFRLFAV